MPWFHIALDYFWDFFAYSIVMEFMDDSINPSNAMYPEDMKPSNLDLVLGGTGDSDGGMSSFGTVIVVLMCTALVVLVAVAAVATVVYKCKKIKTVRKYVQIPQEEDNDVGE